MLPMGSIFFTLIVAPFMMWLSRCENRSWFINTDTNILRMRFYFLCIVLFDLFLYVPVNNLSVIKGRVFLG